MKLKCLLLSLLLATSMASADPNQDSSHDHKTPRADDHAPIGVMGDHLHKKGEFMFSYRFKTMHMDGNRSGSSSVSNAQVLSRFMVTPTEMDMSAHMLGMMYAPSDDVTLMLGLPFMHKTMKHLTRRGGTFTTNSDGIGDIKATALVRLWDQDQHHVHLNAGISLPTGSIDVRGTTPMGSGQLLPYPMQLGSGTFDLRPGITYTGMSDNWSWGAQANGVVRLGQNDRGYTLGNEFGASLWGAHKWNNHLSTSLRLNGTSWGDISGRDAELNPRVIPTADPTLRGGSRVDLLLGVNSYIADGHRLNFEFGVPISQSLDGPQLETDYTLTAGWQLSF